MRKYSQFICPSCKIKYKSLSAWGKHMKLHHSDDIPKGFTTERYFYYLKTGMKNGKCRQCKGPTDWNQNTLKYNRFCNDPKCKEKFREIFKNRMINKYGKVHLLNDPEKQREMASHKKISGEYTFTSGQKISYMGTYELDFLKMLDKFLHFSSSDVMGPSPHTYYYDYKNAVDKEHEGRKFYIPDFYIPSLNLEIEIKQGTNKHPKILAIDKIKELEKDDIMKKNPSVNYLKIMDKDYSEFFDFLLDRKKDFVDSCDDDALDIAVESFVYSPQQEQMAISAGSEKSLMSDAYHYFIERSCQLIRMNPELYSQIYKEKFDGKMKSFGLMLLNFPESKIEDFIKCDYTHIGICGILPFPYIYLIGAPILKSHFLNVGPVSGQSRMFASHPQYALYDVTLHKEEYDYFHKFINFMAKIENVNEADFRTGFYITLDDPLDIQKIVRELIYKSIFIKKDIKTMPQIDYISSGVLDNYHDIILKKSSKKGGIK